MATNPMFQEQQEAFHKKLQHGRLLVYQHHHLQHYIARERDIMRWKEREREREEREHTWSQ